jgi:hypothetical protein
MGKVRFGPARVPSRESPEAAIGLLEELGFDACEIDFEGKFWMDYDWAAEFGKRARKAKIILSVHAPIAGFMGHAERGKKLNMATGMLDHSAGIGRRPARSSWFSTPASCSNARVRRRSTRSASSSASCASGWRARTGRFPSASR